MFDRIRKLFSSSKPSPPDNPSTFIEQLAASSIWILAIGIRGTPELPFPDDPRAWDIIHAHYVELAQLTDDDSVFPFNYGKNGQQILPFFSSDQRARDFLASKSWGSISFFQPFRMQAGFVAASENDRFELLLDPGTPSERKLNLDERFLLRSLS